MPLLFAIRRPPACRGGGCSDPPSSGSNSNAAKQQQSLHSKVFAVTTDGRPRAVFRSVCFLVYFNLSVSIFSFTPFLIFGTVSSSQALPGNLTR